MSAQLDALSGELLALPADQRLSLASRLLASVEPETDSDADAAWEAEIAARIARSDAGESKFVPAEEVFARLRRVVADARRS